MLSLDQEIALLESARLIRELDSPVDSYYICSWCNRSGDDHDENCLWKRIKENIEELERLNLYV